MSSGEAPKTRTIGVETVGRFGRPAAGAKARATPDRPELMAFECSLATASLDALESLDTRFAPERVSGFFEGTAEIGELVVLRTCHRFELYCWSSAPERLSERLGAELDPGAEWRVRRAEDAVRHLFRVAAGLESTALGEREVRDQVRAAAAHVYSRHPRPVLLPLLLGAVAAAEASAPRVPKNRSIAALAAARVLEEAAQPFPRVLVVGSGIVGRGVAEQLAPYGRVTLVYRTRPPDAGFLRATDARAVPWASLPEELPLADVVVTAVKTAGRILGPAELGSRRRPLVVIDLGLPRNVDPALRNEGALRLVDLEGLRARSPPAPLTEVEERVASEAALAYREVAAASFEAWVDEFRRGSERTRRELLAESERSLAELTPSQREAVERLTRRLAARLLAGPTEGLRAIPPGAEGDERRRWAWELLRACAPRS